MKRIALIISLVLTVTFTTLVAPVASAADGAPRAMPTDYAKAGLGTKQYGIPRAMPSHYGNALDHQVGIPRAMPSDYAAADIDVRPTNGGRSHGVFDSSSDVTVAVALGLAGAVLLTAVTLAVLRSRRRFASS
jgi:hypothetical protein